MSHRTDIFPLREGESITDWTLRFLFDVAQERIETGQLVYAVEENAQVVYPSEEERTDMDRRRLVDLYHACTPRESEYAESPLDDEAN